MVDLFLAGLSWSAIPDAAPVVEAGRLVPPTLLLLAGCMAAFGFYSLGARRERRRAHERSAAAVEQGRLRERRFRSLIEHSRDVVTILDRDGTILYESAAVARVLGYDPETTSGTNAFARIHPSDLQSVQELFVRGVEQPDFHPRLEFRVRHRDGSWRTIEAEGANLLDDPAVAGIVIHSRDVTERVEAQEALRETDERLRLALAADRVAIWEWDVTSDWITWFSEPARLQFPLPCTLDEFRELVHPDDRDDVLRAIDAALAGERDYRVDHRIVAPDGRVFWVGARATVHRSDTGEPLRMLGVCSDITRRKEMEQALRKSEEWYRRLFEEDLTANFVADARGRIVACNAAFARLFGFDSVAHALEHGELPSIVGSSTTIHEMVTREGTIHRTDLTLADRNDQHVHVLANAYGTFGPDGALLEVRGHFMDLTSQRRLEDQLRHSQKMEAIGRLAGGIAHDFNNLLMVIKGYSEFLLRGIAEADPRRGDVEEIRNAASHASSLTKQLLAFSRRQLLQPRLLDLNHLVHDTDRMLRRVIGEDIALRIVPNAGPLWVVADPGQLQQVILNLAVNARDAMPTGGELVIEIRHTELDEDAARAYASSVSAGTWVVLAVTDTGSGMDEETLSHIFEPFYTTKRPGQGTGLGLSTVYGIIQQSGGHVEVTSREGEGTAFEIYLPPAGEVAAEAGATSGNMEPVRPDTACTVLVVEDDPAVRQIIRRVLEAEGFTVLETADGRAALECADEFDGEIDLLITDVIMPNMSGRELADRLTARCLDLPVLYISGYSGDFIARHGVLEPGVALIEKPFAPNVLVTKVGELLGTIRNG